MDYKEITAALAPCGLHCRKCGGFIGGEIQQLSMKLKNCLGAFDAYAEKFSKFMPVFTQYPQFKSMLDHFTKASCTGCRQGGACNPRCGVVACYKEKGVDFCFQCVEFPCEKTLFDPHLKQRWLAMNTRMKEIGIEAYYQEIKDAPRYV